MQTLHQLDANQTNPIVEGLVAVNSNFPLQIGKKVYHIESKLKVNWYEANNICRQLGGHLLNIESREEMDAILAKTPNGNWISGNCLSKFGSWISATSGYSMPYLKWLPGEPNNWCGDEYCIELYLSGFNDLGCHIARNFICEAKYV